MQLLAEWSSIDTEIKELLLKKGYKFLGKGVDQMAFLEPKTGQVYKVFGTKKTADPTAKQKKFYFSKEQQGFINWAKFCKGSTNKFLPKFYGMESFVFKNKVYLQIRQELLYKIPSKWEYVMNIISDRAQKGYPLKNQHLKSLMEMFQINSSDAKKF